MIKAVILDVDGVLTDGKKYYFGSQVSKSFSVRDGKGIDIAQKLGIKFAIITADNWEPIKYRAKQLNISDVFYNAHDKIHYARNFCKANNFNFSDISFIADDVNDIPLLKVVGLPIAVGDAMDEVKSVCKWGYVTKKFGGNGAVREALDFIVKMNDAKLNLHNFRNS